MNDFGQFIKSKRLQRRMGLRTFCQEVPIDPSNYSKVERGVADAPQPGSPTFVAILAALGIAEDSEDGREIGRLAELQRGRVPKTITDNEEIKGILPAFFRALDGGPLSDQERQELINLIRNS